MDNYFSNINLFNFLRNKKIGACGTVRTNSAKFPNILKIKRKLNWNILFGVVIDNVLAIVWIDNGPVNMLTTIHEINGPQYHIERFRRRPRITNANAIKIQNVFGNDFKKKLPIPIVIDDYNHFMKGVDIADQLRSNYIIQFPVQRTWVPLFFWLLDTAIINSYLIFKLKNKNNESHKSFRLNLAWKLIELGLKLDEERETYSKGKQKLTSILAASTSTAAITPIIISKLKLIFINSFQNLPIVDFKNQIAYISSQICK